MSALGGLQLKGFMFVHAQTGELKELHNKPPALYPTYEEGDKHRREINDYWNYELKEVSVSLK